jgi:C4-dicarboxylate-specific signal transduction histidine kinase
MAWCDQNRLEQVLINLIRNAADAMADSPRTRRSPELRRHPPPTAASR